MALAVGTTAPSFTTTDDEGNTVSLSVFAGKTVFLYFYPKDDTPGCTKQAQSFRDNYTEYQGKGFATEALTKDFEYLISKTETHRIIGLLDTENHGSRKLVENLNFRREAHFKKSFWDKKLGEWRDEYLYAMLKEDWENTN